MQVFVCVCFIAAFAYNADGQEDTSTVCKNVADFDPCQMLWECDLKVSQCFCKSETPYCRCNNYIDEFYIGKSCSQKWTTLTFALVATLPGVALAFVIGVAVHLAHRFGKPSKSHGAGNDLIYTQEQDLFPGVVFASDLNSPQSARPPAARPPGPTSVQVGLPMVPSRPYSVSGNTQFVPGGPPMGISRPQYSALDNTHPAFDRPPQGPLYSYTGGRAQVLSNTHVRARNPYEESSVSAEPYNQPASPRAYEDQRMAPPPAPPYGTPDYRSALPRAQIGRLH